ncbi:hypothetical protein XENOCAPTIV_026533 [Xenoophorus captivus]|uniref:Uncharacterized protein n=1 Tax=Xenoophorus captivus TaxID=1517983 RepID=A0ABV0QCM5_9TELE
MVTYLQANFSPHRFFKWNNKDILFKRRTLCLDSWFNLNINLIDQLFDNAGILLSYEGFLSKCNIRVSSGVHAKVFGVISTEICVLFRQRPDSILLHLLL